MRMLRTEINLLQTVLGTQACRKPFIYISAKVKGYECNACAAGIKQKRARVKRESCTGYLGFGGVMLTLAVPAISASAARKFVTEKTPASRHSAKNRKQMVFMVVVDG